MSRIREGYLNSINVVSTTYVQNSVGMNSGAFSRFFLCLLGLMFGFLERNSKVLKVQSSARGKPNYVLRGSLGCLPNSTFNFG